MFLGCATMWMVFSLLFIGVQLITEFNMILLAIQQTPWWRLVSHRYHILCPSCVTVSHIPFHYTFTNVIWSFTQELSPELSGERRLKLLVHGENFQTGRHIADNIYMAVRQSRKTLVILTMNMLKSHWCNYELQVWRFSDSVFFIL